MENEEQRRRAQVILAPMEESARPAFDDEDIDNLRTLVRLTVSFYDYLTPASGWPGSPSGPFHDMTYMTESILIHVDEFRRTVHSYGCIVGATGSTIDWNTTNIRSIKDKFFSAYGAFVKETTFENKCRLLLDLVKLQIVFAGAFFDCMP